MARLKDGRAPLPVAEAAVLLGGWGSRPPEQPDARVGFDLFGGDAHLAALWRTYEAHLRALARAWDWLPTWWVLPANQCGLRFVVCEQVPATASGPYYYSEALALAGPQSI